LNKRVENSRVSIGIFGSKSSFLTTVPVDTTGRFSLSGIDITEDARLIVTGIGKKDRLQGVLLLDSVIYIPAKVTNSLSQVSILVENKWSSLKTYYEINESIRKKYKLSDTISLGEVKIISERHKDPQTVKVENGRSKYGKPEGELVITDQMSYYPNAFEVLRGRIPGVEVIKLPGGDSKYSIRIRGITTLAGSTAPLFLVDGTVTTYDDFINIPVNFIDRIDVLKSGGACAIFGLSGTNGVINIITKSGSDVFKYTPATYSTNKRFSGYNAPRIFYSPSHLTNSTSDYSPDLRSTLYWKPDITVDGSNKVILNYYNGDNASLIKIIAEGITTSGIPVTGKAEYEVR
jgi:hypothetical protein